MRGIWKLNLAAGIALFLAAAAASSAAVIVTVQSESLSQSSSVSSGFFDVYLSTTGTGNGNIQAWQTRVNIDPGSASGMTLGTPAVTDAAPSVRSMLLGTDTGFTTPLGGSVPNSATQVSAEQDIASSVALDGVTGAGLMRVPFTLAANAHGTYTLDLSTDSNTGTVLVNSTPAVIPFTAVNGTITVSVPEPASFGAGLLAIGLLSHRRRRAS